MKRLNLYYLTFAAVVVVVIAGMVPGSLQAQGKPQVTVSGGGTATFDFVEGLQSQFSVGARINADGTAQGHFTCMIVGVVTIAGKVQLGTDNGDGTVTLSGVANGIEHGIGPFQDCAFMVTLGAGGPGVGEFLYSDCVVPPPGDAETVARGHIMINTH